MKIKHKVNKMVLVGSLLNVTDNSGALKVKCLKILGVGYRKYGEIGDIVIVSVRKVNPLKELKKGAICRGVIVRVNKEVRRKGGEEVRCFENAIVLVKNDNMPVGSRIRGPVFGELRQKGFSRIVSQARGTF